MLVGDEHAVIRAVSGTLPTQLEHEELLTVPRAMARILRSYERLLQGAADPGGQISSRLRVLTPLALEAILDPEPDMFRVLTDEELRPGVKNSGQESRQSEPRRPRRAFRSRRLPRNWQQQLGSSTRQYGLGTTGTCLGGHFLTTRVSLASHVVGSVISYSPPVPNATLGVVLGTPCGADPGPVAAFTSSADADASHAVP